MNKSAETFKNYMAHSYFQGALDNAIGKSSESSFENWFNRDKSLWEEYAKSSSPAPRWVKASELPLKEKALPDVVITQMENGKVFAYDTEHNLSGLKEIIKHHPEIKCYLLNKSDESQTEELKEEAKNS